MIGVKGWFSANQRIAAGIESVGTNPLPRKGSRIRGIGRLLAVSTFLETSPSATASQITAKVTIVSRPIAATHSSGPAVGPNPMSERDADDDRDRDQRLDQAADDVPGQDRDAGDRHRPEAGDDALAHVHGDRDRRALGRAGHREHEDARASRSRGTRRARPTRRPGRRPACRRRRTRTAAGRRSGCRRSRRPTRGSAACGGGCAAASSRSPGWRRTVLIACSPACLGEGEEDVVEVGGVDGQVGRRRSDSASSRSSTARSDAALPSLGTVRVSASSPRDGVAQRARRPRRARPGRRTAAGCARRGRAA